MEKQPTTPSDIAREVLKRLAVSRVPPTPDNFRNFYCQIAGTTPEEAFPEREFKALAASLPRETPEQLRIARRFEGAITEREWESFRTRMLQMMQEFAESSPPWAALIRDLLAQLERRHADLSPQRKRESLEHVLSSSQADAQQLFSRLQGMIKGWSAGPDAENIALVDALVEPAPSPAIATPPEGAPAAPASTAAATSATTVAPAVQDHRFDEELRSLIAQLLEEAIGAMLIDTPELTEQARAFAAELRGTANFDLLGFAERMRAFIAQVQWVVQDQSGIRTALLKLLQLIIENINDLVLEDSWLQGQLASLMQITSQPLARESLDELARRLRDVIFKQGTLKRNMVEAQERLKEMLAGFVSHLSDFYESTGEYGGRMEQCAEKVAGAASIDELSDVISELIRETRAMQARTEKSRSDLSELRAHVSQANAEINRLQKELEAKSEMVRHDPLTGALNRKGLDDAMEREIGRARRSGNPICVALIDVDNFKALNDTLGHRAGDDALIHLARVIQDTLRPNDTVARYGGEEFVVVLPDTQLEDGICVIQRLQRELTKRFFLHENRKLLITFSAGVALLNPGENPQIAIDRADEAMYQAKRAGKNRVYASNRTD